jgi:hypothetical protein
MMHVFGVKMMLDGPIRRPSPRVSLLAPIRRHSPGGPNKIIRVVATNDYHESAVSTYQQNSGTIQLLAADNETNSIHGGPLLKFTVVLACREADNCIAVAPR